MDGLMSRITIDPAICHGKPCVRGLRYPVETLLELLSSGMTFDEILTDYQDLERDDLLAVAGICREIGKDPSPATGADVNFIVDAQLPRRAAGWLRAAGCDAVHTLDLPDANHTSDARIIDLAERDQRAVVTKDADFVDSHTLHGRPAEAVADLDRKHQQ